MKAVDIMTRRVISVGRDASVFEAARLMLQHRISGLPVVDPAGILVGMITEGDFLRRAEAGTERHRPRWLEVFLGPGRAAVEYTHSHGRKVYEVMSDQPYSVSEDTPLEKIVDLMESHRIKRVPVTRDGRLIGIVSRANLMRAMLPIVRSALPRPKRSRHTKAHRGGDGQAEMGSGCPCRCDGQIRHRRSLGYNPG